MGADARNGDRAVFKLLSQGRHHGLLVVRDGDGAAQLVPVVLEPILVGLLGGLWGGM